MAYYHLSNYIQGALSFDDLVVHLLFTIPNEVQVIHMLYCLLYT